METEVSTEMETKLWTRRREGARADVEEIGEVVQSTPKTRKTTDRNERSACTDSNVQTQLLQQKEDMYDECNDEDLLIQSCEHASGMLAVRAHG